MTSALDRMAYSEVAKAGAGDHSRQVATPLRSSPVNDAAALNDFDRRPFELVIYERKHRRQVRLPSSGDVVIGRSADCDVRLEDRSISRRHAVLHMSSLEVEDLDSKNGSWLFAAKPGLSWESVADGVSGEGAKLVGGVCQHF